MIKNPLLLPLVVIAVFVSGTAPAPAQEAALSAKDLAARLSTALQDGASTVRLKLEIERPPGGAKTVLQLQIKSLRSATGTSLSYQVLWPKERKGEGFVLRQTGDRAPAGTGFTLPDALRPISGSQITEAVFGSDLSYEDLVDSFFAWDQQTITGNETVDRVPCVIIESKPGKGDLSNYGRVRSWIDPKRLVPLRIEKLSASGQVVRRIDTTRIAKDDAGRAVPASFTVSRTGQNSLTTLEGSNSRHDVKLSESDFTPEALRSPAR